MYREYQLFNLKYYNNLQESIQRSYLKSPFAKLLLSGLGIIKEINKKLY